MRFSHAIALGAVALALPSSGDGTADGPPAPLQDAETAVVFYWTGLPREESVSDARTLMLQLQAHIDSNYSQDYPLRVYGPVLEGVRRTHWFGTFSGIGDRIRVEQLLERDGAWQSMVDGLDDTFEPDSIWMGYLYHLGGASPAGGSTGERWVRTTYSPLMKMPAAQQRARRIAEHLEANYPEIDASVYTAEYHDRSMIVWMIDYHDLDAWSRFRAKLVRDDVYVDLYEGTEGLFLEQRTTETMMSRWTP